MPMSNSAAAEVPITNELFSDFLRCKYKAYLKLTNPARK